MTREEILQIAKPILFNTQMVCAILDNRKKTTRRIVKSITPLDDKREYFNIFRRGEWSGPIARDLLIETYAPYKIGDYLYVRETWMLQAAKRYDALVRIGYRAGIQSTTIHFPYGGTDSINRDDYDSFVSKRSLDRWYPSIHMPKKAARIFLRVADVRVELLQDIDGRGILAEGVNNIKSNPEMGRRWENMQRIAFWELWDSTISKKDIFKYGWAANPWVWVIKFERVEVQ